MLWRGLAFAIGCARVMKMMLTVRMKKRMWTDENEKVGSEYSSFVVIRFSCLLAVYNDGGVRVVVQQLYEADPGESSAVKGLAVPSPQQTFLQRSVSSVAVEPMWGYDTTGGRLGAISWWRSVQGGRNSPIKMRGTYWILVQFELWDVKDVRMAHNTDIHNQIDCDASYSEII